MKKIIFAAFLLATTLPIFAQSSTNSPYSQYGLGLISDQSNGAGRGMNGLGIAFHESNLINALNPASYAKVDSMTFIFDVGMSGQITNIEENGSKINANNGAIDYIIAGFRMAKHLGASFGLLPFSNIGYKYSNTGYVTGDPLVSPTKYVNTYSGEGGIHQGYLGLGWEPIKGISFGANFSYLWGSYTRSINNNYSDADINTITKYYTADVSSYKIDLGVQLTGRLGKKDEVTLGATYTFNNKLGADPEYMVISRNSQTSVSDTAKLVVDNGLEMPMKIGAGLMWNHAGKLKVGVDYELQKWGDVEFPEYSVVNDQPQYALTKGLFKDRSKYTFGGEYCKNALGRRFTDRIRYRAGVSYTTPYLKINGADGPKEIGVSAGFGIPIVNQWNNRSILNISAQWTQQSATGMIKENTFRINVGITFNERWFAKWKVE